MIPLTDTDRARIAEAVTAAEAHTDGEIVPVIAAASDHYADVALVWAALSALAVLTALGFAPDAPQRLVAPWDAPWGPRALLGGAAVATGLAFVAVWLALHWPPLRRVLTPAPLAHRRVRARAVAAFHLAAERRTTSATGVLIYLSRAERRAEIVADASIAAKVAPEVWGEAMAAMLAHIGDGRIGEGVAAGIAKVGAVLAEHFPAGAHATNQLPDEVIEL